MTVKFCFQESLSLKNEPQKDLESWFMDVSYTGQVVGERMIGMEELKNILEELDN